MFLARNYSISFNIYSIIELIMIIIVVVTTEARQQSEAYSELLGVNYFCKILHLRCLAVF